MFLLIMRGGIREFDSNPGKESENEKSTRDFQTLILSPFKSNLVIIPFQNFKANF